MNGVAWAVLILVIILLFMTVRFFVKLSVKLVMIFAILLIVGGLVWYFKDSFI